MLPVVVLSAHLPGLGVIRALGEMHVPIVVVSYRRDDVGRASKHAKLVIDAPHPEHDEARFVDVLVEAAARLRGALLVPASDEMLKVVSRHLERLQTYYRVACTPWSVTERIVDKQHTYALAESLGIPIPRTIVPRSDRDVERYISEARFPCLVKPSQSHLYVELFRKKLAVVDSADELRAEYRAASEAGLEVMLQELIPGQDSLGVNYNSYVWDGEPLVEFTAQKLRIGPPYYGNPCVVVSRRIPEVIEPGRRLLRSLGYAGFACTEFKRDPRDGVYKLLEVNGRHNLSSLLAVRCGINFPWIQYCHLVANQAPRPTPFRQGLYWIDGTKDMFHFARALASGSSPLDLARPYRRPHVFAVWDRRDPGPFVKRVLDQARTPLASKFESLSRASRRTAPPGTQSGLAENVLAPDRALSAHSAVSEANPETGKE